MSDDDPYTGNRYAFTGGNPINRVELDGHMLCSQPGPYCGLHFETPDTSDTEQKTKPAGDDLHFQRSYNTESDGTTGFEDSSAYPSKPIPGWENLVGSILYRSTQTGKPPQRPARHWRLPRQRPVILQHLGDLFWG